MPIEGVANTKLNKNENVVGEMDGKFTNPTSPAGLANKFVAKYLLMKCYLNKAVFIKRTIPFFDASDMNGAIEKADDKISINKYLLNANYINNLVLANSRIGGEYIFTQLKNEASTPDNAMVLAWKMSLHYSQDGINRWTTFSDFYDKFETIDRRRGVIYKTAGSPQNAGNRINLGFLFDQEYVLITNNPMAGASGSLINTRGAKNIETGTSLDGTWIGPLKYFTSWPNYFSPDNDCVFSRFPDVLLIKGDVISKGGTLPDARPCANSALTLLNTIRTNSSRSASVMILINFDGMYDEQGRVLMRDSRRRQDLIQLKIFLPSYKKKGY